MNEDHCINESLNEPKTATSPVFTGLQPLFKKVVPISYFRGRNQYLEISNASLRSLLGHLLHWDGEACPSTPNDLDRPTAKGFGAAGEGRGTPSPVNPLLAAYTAA